MAVNRRIVIEMVALAALVAVIFNFNAVADEIALYTFTPSADLQPIIDQLQLTNHAKAVLYRSRPQLDDKTAFDRDCNPAIGELELGCFIHNRIYILRIDNASLAPEMTVVLAHELLHAVWEQESSADHAKLAPELEAAYHAINDPDLTSRMADYAKSEPGEQDNELHSILGTEYPNLSPELEAHYASLFGDRSVIVKAEAAYRSVFSTRRNQLDAEKSQIMTLKSQLGALQAQMAAYRARGDIASYNALVPRQNALADQVNGLVNDYNQGVDEYNALSSILDANQLTPVAQ